MLLYEMFAIGVAVVLVVAAIGGLAARVMMGPEETALLRLARAAPAQRRLVASAAQQERDARAAAAAQRRLEAAAAQQDDWIRRWLKRQYEDALAVPLPPRLATLIAHLGTLGGTAHRGSRMICARACASCRSSAAAVRGRAMSALIPLRLICLRCSERRFVPKANSWTAATTLAIRSPGADA